MLGFPVTLLLSASLAFTPWTSGVAPLEPGGGDAFAKASIVPPSASFYLRAVDGRTLRRELSSRPMGAAIAATVLDNTMLGAWRTLAEDLRCDEGELFDRLFGRDVTLAIRWSPEGVDWALISAVDTDEIDRLLAPSQRAPLGRRGDGRSLGAALGVSFLGGGWREFARQKVAAWHRDGVLVVAPAGQRILGDEVVELIAAAGGPRLGNDEALAEARALGGQGPRVEFFTRLPQQPDAGALWTAAVAELRGRVVEIRRRSNVVAIDESAASPLSHALATLARDSAAAGADAKASDVLDRLRDGGVVAFVEPLGDHGDASEAIVAMAPDLFGVHGAELRLLRALADGPTTVIVASKAVRHAPADSSAPSTGNATGADSKGASVALVTEIRNPMEAAKLQERGLRERDAASMATVMAGAPCAGDFPSGSSNSSSSSSSSNLTCATGSSSPLYMQVITTDRGRWKVVCNDAALLGRVVNELHTPADAPGATITIAARTHATVRGIGMLDGRGLAIQMRGPGGSMFGLPAALDGGGGAPRSIDGALRSDRAAPGAPDATAPINEWVAEWASAIDTLRWVLSRPQPDRVELRATVELVDGERDGVGLIGR